MASEIDVANKQPHVAVLCAVGFIAAILTWSVLQWQYPFFTVSDEYSIGMGASNEAREALMSQQARVDQLNAAIILCVGGGLLAGLLSVFARPCCSLLVRLLPSIVAGALWGAVVGYLGPILFALLMPKDSLPGPTSVGFAQALVFALFGAGIGFLFAVVGRNKHTLLTATASGAVAGAAAGVLFPMIAGLVLPSQSTVSFIGESGMVRLLWLSLPMIAIAAAIPVMCAKQPGVVAPDNTSAEPATSPLVLPEAK